MTIGISVREISVRPSPRNLARAGIEAIIANSRGPDSLRDLVKELGPTIKAGTREEAAKTDIVFIA